MASQAIVRATPAPAAAPAIDRAAGAPAPGGAAARRADFEFDLPPELIAQRPARRREDARLLHLRADGCADLGIVDLPGLIDAGDVLVLNDTRVIKARLHGEKASGGRVEGLIERILDERRALMLLRTSHAPRAGLRLRFGGRFGALVVGREEDLFELQFDAPLAEVLEAVGEVPLPPYIRHAPRPEDALRYQTVYARHPGAVAAPTAGLHLTEDLLAQARARGARIEFVTLHVGAGTFQPVRSERLGEHRMHREWFDVPPRTAAAVNAARATGGRIVAVGTTSVRALESAMRDGQLQAGSGETRLFILPGFRFQCVDRLLTNFHLPGSTLLMLVSAFAGGARIRAAYAHAIAAHYRFFSYGDAMLLERERRA